MQIALTVSEESRSLACVIYPTRNTLLFKRIPYYPRGQENYDLRTGEEGERPEVLENIRDVPTPETDPLFGEEGPLLGHWAG